MGSAEHALQLQFLLRKLHAQPNPSANTDFTRFIYFQCYPKIKQHLYLPVRSGSRPFIELFSNDQITPEELLSSFDPLGAEFLVLDEKVLLHADGWIAQYWRLCLPGQDPDFEERDGEKYLVYSAAMTVGLHSLIGRMFALLAEDLDRVRNARTVNTKSPQVVTNEYIRAVESALDGVDWYMEFFASLVQSPCFRNHITHPVVQDWVLNQARTRPNEMEEVGHFTPFGYFAPDWLADRASICYRVTTQTTRMSYSRKTMPWMIP